MTALVKDLNKLPSQSCENNAPALKENQPQKETETKRITPRNLLRLSEDNGLFDDGNCLPAIPEDKAYAPEVDEEPEEEEMPQMDDVIGQVQSMDNVDVVVKEPDADAPPNEQEEPPMPCPTNENSVADVLRKVRPVNTRPKRRDSSLVETLISKKDVDTGNDDAVSATAGSKRKFDAHESENLPQAKQQKDDFQYTLTKKNPNKLPGDIGIGTENEPGLLSMGKEGMKNSAEPVKSRKALEPSKYILIACPSIFFGFNLTRGGRKREFKPKVNSEKSST